MHLTIQRCVQGKVMAQRKDISQEEILTLILKDKHEFTTQASKGSF